MPHPHESGVGDVADVSDVDLVLRSRSGDTAAFRELWARHYRAGIVAAASITTGIDADDLVQEAYAKIFQTIRRGGGPTSSFRAYLFTTIRSTAAAWGRSSDDLARDEFERADSAGDAAEATLDRGITHTAFRSLPTRWQEVLWYSEIEQLKPREIAPLLGMKATAVSQLTSRAREGLREAWLQSQLATTAVGSEHRWAIEHLSARRRGHIGSRDRKKLAAHIDDCGRCGAIAAEADSIGGRLAIILLPLAIGIPAAGAYLLALDRGQIEPIALAVMPTTVVEGGAVLGGAVLAGGSSAPEGRTTSAWTVGGLVTAGVTAAAIAALVITGATATHLSAPTAGSADFAPGAPGSASIEASDDLAATEAPDAPVTDTNLHDQDPESASLGIVGASVVNARARTIAIRLQGEPGRTIGVHAPGTTTPVGAGGVGMHRSTANVRSIAGPELGATTFDGTGAATITVALTPDQVRSDVAVSVQYPGSASPPASSALSSLGVLDALLAALEEAEPTTPPAPTATPKPEPTPAPKPEPSVAPAPQPVPQPAPAPHETPTPITTPEPEPEPTIAPSPEPTATPSPEPSQSPTPTPSQTPAPVETPKPSPSAAPELPAAPAKPSPPPSEAPQVPTAPERVEAEIVNEEVHVTWSEVDDAESYNVYVGTDETFDSTAKVKDVEAQDDAELTTDVPTDPGTYYYFVEAANSGGTGRATVSNGVEIPEAPAAPENVSATRNDDDSVLVTWPKVDAAESYNVYVNTAKNFAGATSVGSPDVNSSNLVKFTTETPTTPGRFFYFVEAVNRTGTSEAAISSPIEIRPAAPTDVIAERVRSQIRITWTHAGKDAAYEVYRGTSASIDSAELVATAENDHVCVDQPEDPKAEFYFVKSVVNDIESEPAMYPAGAFIDVPASTDSADAPRCPSATPPSGTAPE